MFVRFFILILKRFISKQSKISVFDSCRTSFWVSPFDLDTNMHMNNGRYLSIMDFGRFDLLIKSGSFKKLVKAGYFPVVVSESIRFKKSLNLFDSFILETQIDFWDEKDFYIVQKFLKKDQVMAVGYIKGRFMNKYKKGSVETKEVFKFMDEDWSLPSKTDLALSQDQVENQLYKKIKEE